MLCSKLCHRHMFSYGIIESLLNSFAPNCEVLECQAIVFHLLLDHRFNLSFVLIRTRVVSNLPTIFIIVTLVHEQVQLDVPRKRRLNDDLEAALRLRNQVLTMHYDNAFVKLIYKIFFLDFDVAFTHFKHGN